MVPERGVGVERDLGVEGVHLAGRDIETHAIQRKRGAKPLTDAGEAEAGRHHGHHGPTTAITSGDWRFSGVTKTQPVSMAGATVSPRRCCTAAVTPR